MSVRDDYPLMAASGEGCDAPCSHATCRRRREMADALNELQRLRSQNEAWMNGVADVVEVFGYDRQAACGPADLLPGLETLVQEWSEGKRHARHLLRGSALPDPGPLSTVSHRVIPQAGSNLCVCGEWFDAEVHQVATLAPDGNDRHPCTCGEPWLDGTLHRADGQCMDVSRLFPS